MTHLIIAGHGMQPNGVFDPGATGFISKGEHRYVKDDLFPAMKKFLPKNHNVVFFDKYKVSTRGNIVTLAKQYNASQVTEIHFDSAGAAASGGHVIIHRDYAPDKVDLALRDAINGMVGLANRTHRGHKGIHGRNDLINVNLTRNAKITYRLIELGYGASNKRDARILTENVEEYAKELVKAITGTSNDRKPSKTSSKPKQSNSKPKTTNKSIAQMAQEIIDGKHGNGHENRRKSLGISKSEYEKVRKEVNRLVTGNHLGVGKKSIKTIAREVIQGKWGNGADRKRRLTNAGYDYAKVQAEVNRRLK